jgi:lipoprotein-anchoring transpeptidase ErfK/SrfK
MAILRLIDREWSGALTGILRRLLISLVLASGAQHALVSADDAAAVDSLAQSYGVLERMGLLAPSTPVSVAAPEPALVNDNAAMRVEVAAVSVPEGLSRAYQVLRARGLLTPDGVSPSQTRSDTAYGRKADRVLVLKSERKLFLMRNGVSYREYPISLGGAPEGHKQQAGDLRTPEGVYTLDWRNPKSRYYKSIHISYPNQFDRMRAEQRGVDPGGMIMLHGEHYIPAMQRIYRRATRKDWTEGCIALNNEHIDEIWSEVRDGTPIEIRP